MKATAAGFASLSRTCPDTQSHFVIFWPIASSAFSKSFIFKTQQISLKLFKIWKQLVWQIEFSVFSWPQGSYIRCDFIQFKTLKYCWIFQEHKAIQLLEIFHIFIVLHHLHTFCIPSMALILISPSQDSISTIVPIKLIPIWEQRN